MSVILLPVEAKHSAFHAGKANGSDAARWTSPSKNSLGDLVADLSEEYKQKVDVTSIPDIWAGPKAFEAQLLDDIEEQRAKWRAVLAIIGLRKVLRFNLSVKSIAVPKVGSVVYNKKTTHPFLKVVSRLMDKEFASYPGGDKINLIVCNNQTIAMVWPNSIVYPMDCTLTNIPWLEGGKYHDPAKSKVISEQERLEAEEAGEEVRPSRWLSDKQSEILAKWLNKLRKKVADYDTTTASEISDFLNAYISELGFDVKELPEHDNPEELLFTADDPDFAIDGYGSMLSQVYSTPSTAEDLDLSQIRLDSLDKSKHILVIDDEIASQWKMEPSNIICFGATDLGSAVAMLKDIDKTRAFIEESKLPNFNTELWTANDFFTDKIVYVTGFTKESSPFPNSLTEADEYRKSFCFDFGKNNMQEFILPIRKEVLDFISAKDLVDSIEIVRENPIGSVKVSLHLQLSGTNPKNKQEFVLSKEFAGEDIVKRTSIPNVQIWPNFKAKCWKQYYVFLGNSLEPNMSIEPAWSNATAEDLNFDVNAQEIKVNIRRGAEFPAVFECKTIDRDQEEAVGLICMNEANLEKPASNVNKKEIYIGVDFGTTNSAVYYTNQLGGDDAEREQIMMANRNFSVTRIKEDNKADLRRYFFPASSQPEGVTGVATKSIRTISHDFNLADPNQVVNKEQPLVCGNIYYLENGTNISDDKVVIDELKGNIKWADKQQEVANERRMHAFVQQLCLQSMAEAVMMGAEKLNWQYSWPSAYDSEKSRRYSDFWTKTLIPAMNDIADISDSKDIHQKTESLSMADYFQYLPDSGKAFTNGLLTIDIGGGSTDIAIWKGKDDNDKLKCWHQCSFKMAGTDILSNYLKSKYKSIPDLLRPFGANNRTLEEKLNKLQELAEAAQKGRENWKTFELELESILKYSEKELMRGMGVTAYEGKQYQELNIVMRDIAFALGGIFYYAGLIIGHLRKYNENCTIKDRLPDCFVGGNGSKLLDWAAKGTFNNNDALETLFRMSLFSGMQQVAQMSEDELSNFNIMSSITQSELPKHEVSYGLISGAGNSPDEVDEAENTSSASAVNRNPGMASALALLQKKDGAQNSLRGDLKREANKKKNKVYPVVAGEMYSVGGAAYSDKEMLTAENFTDRNKFIDVDFTSDNNCFVAYCNLFNILIDNLGLFSGKNIIFDYSKQKDDLQDIFDNVSNDLQSRRTITGEAVVVEPIFIMELREALKKLSKY